MGKVKLEDIVTAHVEVTVTFDTTTGEPVSAVGQKQTIDETAKEADQNDGEPNTLSISGSAKQTYANSLKAAQDAFDQAKADAVSELETQLVAENYTDGVFNTPAAQ